jgi:hypothetical protein
MNVQNMVLTFSQSEKIKAGLIWVSQAIEHYIALPEMERRGAEAIITAIVQMIGGEIVMIRRITNDKTWLEIEKDVDMGMVMIKSQVVPEASFHFTQALTKVTTIAQRAMTALKDQGVL